MRLGRWCAACIAPFLAIGCELDGREFDPPLPEFGGVNGAGAGGLGGAASQNAAGGGTDLGMSGAAAEGPAPVSALGPSEVPEAPTGLANGARCSNSNQCVSNSCAISVNPGAPVCCADSCFNTELCSVDGSRCEPLVLGQGQRCGDRQLCSPELTCALTGPAGGVRVCCAASCASGESCIDGGARCAPPSLGPGVACNESGECRSGYCDIDQRVCGQNPCLQQRAGKYCGRGAQCNAFNTCEFTGMGMVASGTAHTCAILGSGNVRCWGSNGVGQLGAVPAEPIVGDSLDEIPAQVDDLEVAFEGRRAVQVTAGDGHSCALLADGKVRCWGQNAAGELGGGGPNVDVSIPAGEGAVQIDAGGRHTCALLASGAVMCWGDNSSGQAGVGHNDALGSAFLTAVALGERAAWVTAGGAHSCAVLDSGAVTCWGEGQSGALGYGSPNDRLAPTANVDVGGDVSYVASGRASTCVVLTDGAVRCWGDNASGILGYGHPDDIGLTQTPAQAATLTASNGRALGGNVPLGVAGAVQVEVSSDTDHACARFAGGIVRCWGDNASGSLGYGHTVDIGDDETPAQAALAPAGELGGGDVRFGTGVLALAAGGRCAVLSDRSTICWGPNSNGQLGMPELFPGGTPDTTPGSLISFGIGPVRIE